MTKKLIDTPISHGLARPNSPQKKQPKLGKKVGKKIRTRRIKKRNRQEERRKEAKQEHEEYLALESTKRGEPFWRPQLDDISL